MQRYLFTKKLRYADTTFEDMDQDVLVKAVMNDQYGNTYDEELKFWLYKIQEGHRYCMTAEKLEREDLL